jgi:hypothetical protein
MTERTTPETDEASFSTAYQGELVAASFARRLERQRDELLEALVELRDWYLENTGLPAAKANGAIAAVKGGTP